MLAGLDEIRLHLGHVVDDTNQLVDRNMTPIPEPLPAVGDSPEEPASDSQGNVWVAVVLGGLVGLAGVRAIMEKLGKTDKIYFGSSGSSGGGGSSSGGGASGSW